MKKITIIAILASLALLLVACGPASPDLPPTPPAPGSGAPIGRAIVGMAGAMPDWAVLAKNTAVTPQDAYFGDGIIVSVSDFDYIYSTGYYFNSVLRVWEKFEFQGEREANWVKNQGVGSISVEERLFREGGNYVVIYACSKVGKQWDCNNNNWMLASFNVKGKPGGPIPEQYNVDKFVVNHGIPPFTVMATLAEKDNFGETQVIRYDARYKEADGLTVLVHVFDFNNRAELDNTLNTVFRTILQQGALMHKGHRVALFLDQSDHRVSTWSSGTQIVYVETFKSTSANKEIIEAYLEKYPSDLPSLT